MNGSAGGTRLVIVESPAKAKTIEGYLGAGYIVESSIGHIRDLPEKADDIPEQYKGEPWARLGVNVEHEFEPLYVVNPDKRSQVAKLKQLLKDADEVYLATDEDREGEAIAWHLREVLKPKVPVHRMVFHEITQQAIRDAVANPRTLNLRLVDAQETRRILDRLYGYEVSPVLWKKVKPRLSAGRVQSVATRLVVERERERMAFTSAHYWDLQALFDTGRTEERPRDFTANAHRGRRPPRRAGPRLRQHRAAEERRRAPPVGGRRGRAGRPAPGLVVRRQVRRAQAVHPQAVRAVPDDDVAAGGQPQAGVLRQIHDAGGAAPL